MRTYLCLENSQTSQSQRLLLKETHHLQQEGISHPSPILHLLKAHVCSYTHATGSRTHVLAVLPGDHRPPERGGGIWAVV